MWAIEPKIKEVITMTKKMDKNTTIANVELMTKWEDITKTLYQANTLETRATKRRAQRVKELTEKYNDDNAVIKAEIVEIDAEISIYKDIDAACYARLSAIGEKIDDSKHNFATARDAYFSDNYTRSFRGEDKKDVEETIEILKKNVLRPMIDRYKSIDNGNESNLWKESDNDYLKLLTKGEYKKVQNSLSHFAHTIYLVNLKFKADNVAFFLWNAIKPNRKNGLEIGSDNAIRNALIATANIVYMNTEKNNKK